VTTGTIQKLIYQFNQITLDTAQYRLSLSGNPVAVEPQVFDLLTYLIEHKDRVVTRDELLENLWRGKVVTDSALGARLKAARKAVGDSGDRQQVIKTIHGRGYQFVSPVTEINAETEQVEQINTNLNKSNHVSSITPSIAVLPFQNMSGDPEQDYFADGMSEEIITALSRIPDLVVISRNSTFIYKGQAVDVRQVGLELDVGYVLEGSIRKMDDRVRITAQLVNTQSGDHVWAERYDRNLDDIFAVQDEITHNIVVELQIKLVTGEYSRLMAKGTNSIEAWELVIRSVPLSETHVREDAMLAKQLLGRALELDNNYAAAWSLLGWIYWEEAVWEWSSEPEKSMQMAFDAAQKSLSLDEHHPDSYSLLGHIFMERGDTNQAISMCEKATELAPGDAEALALLANILVYSGRVKEGNLKIQKALRLCPFPPPWYSVLLGVSFHLEGDNEAAISALERGIEREPESNLGRPWLASILVEMGRLDEARVVTKAALDIDPTFSILRWSRMFKAKSRARLKGNLITAGFPE
jgi:TolB-like protein/Tfp pilus assembly protein PilF